jgi:hypothetical protein
LSNGNPICGFTTCAKALIGGSVHSVRLLRKGRAKIFASAQAHPDLPGATDVSKSPRLLATQMDQTVTAPTREHIARTIENMAMGGA